MPLSEQEMRLLEEMERNLYHSDADDVAKVGVPRGRANITAMVISGFAFILGITLLLVGVMVRQPLIGVAGFVVMFGGGIFLAAPPARFQVPIRTKSRR